MVLFWNLLYISVCPVWQPWKWAFWISKCREHNWSIAPATVPWNASPCLCQGHASHSCSQSVPECLTDAKPGPLWKAPDSSDGKFWLRIPQYPCLTRCYHAALFSSSLSFYPISDLHWSPMAFSVFPTSLAIFLRGLSTNKSPTHLILLLSTSWGPGITHW